MALPAVLCVMCLLRNRHVIVSMIAISCSAQIPAAGEALSVLGPSLDWEKLLKPNNNLLSTPLAERHRK